MGMKEYAARHSLDCALGDYRLSGDKIVKGLKSWPVAGAVADIELGAEKKGVTATRVVALGVFALAAKKNKSKVYVGIELPDAPDILIEASVKDEAKARKFVANVNQAASAFA